MCSIKSMNKREEIYEILRDDITYGELKLGEKLIELDICKRLNVSRTPVREAIRQLQAEGYIEVIVNRGAVVRKVSAEELQNIYDILAFLEACATESATRLIYRKDLESLKNIINRFDKVKSLDYKKWFDFNNSFHEFFSRNSGNPLLYNEIKKMRNKIYRSRGFIFTLSKNIDKYKKDHEMILVLVEGGDAVKAGNRMKRHIQSTSKLIIQSMKENAWI